MTTNEIEIIAIYSKCDMNNDDSLGVGLRLLGLGTVLCEVAHFLAVETN